MCTVRLLPEALRQWEVHLDGRVLVFALFCALGTTILFGLVPALRLSAVSSMGALRSGTRSSADPARVLMWRTLVAIEVASAVALLAGSALLIRSFSNVLQTQLGFDPSQATIAAVNLPSINYADTSDRVASFHTRVLASLASEPEVKNAGFVSIAPLKGDNISGMYGCRGKGAWA